MALARRPALHFVLIGTLLFLLVRPRAPSPLVALSSGRLSQLRADFMRQTGVPPTPPEEAALIARELDDEVLYREALARGLDRDDPVIRARLIEKMRFLRGTEHAGGERGDDEALHREALALGLAREDVFVRRSLVERMRLIARRAIPRGAPGDPVLQGFLDRHAERYRQPGRVRLSQVFLGTGRRGAGVERDAVALLAALRSPSPPALDTAGDPLPIAPGADGVLTARDLAVLFGADVAARLAAVESGRWTGPLRSAYGLHLVRVDAREPARLPGLPEVRGQVEQAWRFEEGEKAYAAFLARLRRAYGVDEADARTGGAG